MDETDYDYPAMIAEATAALLKLEGHVLWQFLVQIVAPEFNVAYLLLDNATYAIQGRIGGEVLEIVLVDSAPLINADNNTAVKEFAPFSLFLGRRIIGARTIGGAWNGHGFEFSFEGLWDKTMIIQSIYTGAAPPGFEDCLRLGIGEYIFEDSLGSL